ncbi:2-hydroxyacid dehydrogenase [Streptomyces europaeiscabiei]|uniref:2-hydroxyacid dehydrogenase n=2 Tax=Streptomyces TaxID=1883 RepID=UPI0029A423DD|nr:D-glycerate dehydrogenase [Streptomyces europaeiscabiei]MDX3587353.1 D-glycerate dehydrogenase [Streptomyces europaeiscabiei]MDX3636880.1 D-glycerate dehydrogenase [Streptomyces europaeiscabiei]MDX3655105.1 D-glycerate dehydrogenase [Streptomyces europaeiscabiei]
MSGTPVPRPRVAVSRTGLPGPAVGRLASRYNVTAWEGTAPPTSAELGTLVRGCEGLLVLGSDRVDAALLDAAGPGLRVVALASMGYDGVDVDAAAARGVVVTHTPGVLADTTADVAMALILMARRRLGASMASLRRGEWGAFSMDAFLGLDVQGATLGLIGYGQIAKALARRAAGFGMRVQHHHPRRKEDDGLSRWVTFDELLRTSDVVSLHTPLTPETAGMIGAPELARMKPTATLVNTGRGGIVDEEALVAALRAGKLHSAGLDVMVDEPRTDPDDRLFAEPHLVVLPHVGSATEATRAAMVELAASNIEAVLGGEAAPTPLPGTRARPSGARKDGRADVAK